MGKHSVDIATFRNKVHNDLGFETYVEYSREAGWDTFIQEVLKKKVNLVKREQS